MEIKEVLCKSILSKSKLYGTDFSINPYRGCLHACIYCYSPLVLREKRKWGNFIDVKINAPEVLEKDMKRFEKGNILISSVTDPYQPLERKYELTRKILEKLKGRDFFVSILTKSSLVLRDTDLLKEMKCEVGITITSFNEEARKIFEPNTVSYEERLKALNELKDKGIKTYIFFGPLLPFISDMNLEKTIERFASVKPSYILVDRLNVKSQYQWKNIEKILENNYPQLVSKWKKVLFSKNDYYEKLKENIIKICNNFGLSCEFCY
jgi:DNA repair photolyase